MNRVFYAAYHVAYFAGSIASRTVNTIVFGGSMHQTLSSRAWVESFSSPQWARGRKFIDRVIFWEDNHCEESWASEVERARKTLEKNRAIKTWTEPRPQTRKQTPQAAG